MDWFEFIIVQMLDESGQTDIISSFEYAPIRLPIANNIFFKIVMDHGPIIPATDCEDAFKELVKKFIPRKKI